MRSCTGAPRRSLGDVNCTHPAPTNYIRRSLDGQRGKRVCAQCGAMTKQARLVYALAAASCLVRRLTFRRIAIHRMRIAVRSRQCVVLGSGNETAGNQRCQACMAGGGSLTLPLHLAAALAKATQYLMVGGIRFACGQVQINSASRTSRRVSCMTKSGRATMQRVGTALSSRFMHDDEGGPD